MGTLGGKGLRQKSFVYDTMMQRVNNEKFEDITVYVCILLALCRFVKIKCNFLCDEVKIQKFPSKKFHKRLLYESLDDRSLS